MLIEGDPSNWKETFSQFVMLNDLNTADAPMYEEFIENLVNSLTEAWGQIITAKINDSQDVVIPLSLLVKLGGVMKGISESQILLDPAKANFDELRGLLEDTEILEFIENPSRQIYLPIKRQ